MKQFDELPEDVLLEIFDFYMIDDRRGFLSESPKIKKSTDAWQTLIHVCRLWRALVLGSPRRLGLQLLCTPDTPIDTLDIWPAFLPLIVWGNMAFYSGTYNILGALGQRNRVCKVALFGLARLELEDVLAAMQVPFPELTHLVLHLYGVSPVIPDSFLGGSAPRLEHFELSRIPFPALPKLLLSANHLVQLHVFHIFRSGYIAPEAMVYLFSHLSSLSTLIIEFEYRPDGERRILPPPKRSILPALHEFQFGGVVEYLEELVTCIDTPQLDQFRITFISQIDSNTPRLAQFINRTPTLRARDEAHVHFHNWTAALKLRNRTSTFDDLRISVSCRGLGWQLSSIGQVCNSSLDPLSTVEDLYIDHRHWANDAIENALWLDLLVPFTAVENLYLSKIFAQGIAAALQELVGGGIAEVLPSLRNIFVEGLEPSGPFQENIGQFVAARRQLSDHPVAISLWNKNPESMMQEVDD
jgi:hypothetical protein